jgi:hypothetical protein
MPDKDKLLCLIFFKNGGFRLSVCLLQSIHTNRHRQKVKQVPHHHNMMALGYNWRRWPSDMEL